MTPYYAKRALETLNKKGVSELCKQTIHVIKYELPKRPVWWIKYGKIRPKPKEILFIDPKYLDYHISNSYFPDNSPHYGIIDGTWDLEKIHWTDTFFYGLVERFEEGKEWENTEYYQSCIEKLESGKGYAGLDGPQTISNFKQYLDELDQLYDDIKSNGYSADHPIDVSIGRKGEWMVNHGNHRRAILKIVDINEVPVRIKYRHKKWQELRYEIYNSGLSKEHSRELRNHPDLRNIIDG